MRKRCASSGVNEEVSSLSLSKDRAVAMTRSPLARIDSTKRLPKPDEAPVRLDQTLSMTRKVEIKWKGVQTSYQPDIGIILELRHLDSVCRYLAD